jgi:hypothetical protein
MTHAQQEAALKTTPHLPVEVMADVGLRNVVAS